MKLCECGCKTIIRDNVRFVHGHNGRGKKLSKEHKEKLLKSNVGKIKNEDTKNKIRETLIKQWNSPNSIYNSKNYKENRKNFYKSRIGVLRKEETKNKIGIKQIENWSNPTHLFNTKEFRNKLSKIHKKIWKNPFSSYNSKNRSKKISETMKFLYTQPDFLQKYQDGLKVYKNRSEIKLEELLIKLKILSFKFVGDHSVWIGGKNPDFINEDKKMIIELFGDYWHGKDFTGIENYKHELDRVNHYKKFGYKALVVWEYELDGKNIDRKILEFMKG